MERHRLIRSLTVCALVCAVLITALVPRSVRAQTALPTVEFGVTSKTANEWPEYVGLALGFFKQNGIALDMLYSGSAAASAQQLTAGALDISEVSSTQMIEAINGGAPITGFIEHSGKAPYLVLGKKGITSISGLKGKTIIVGGPNDITRVFMDKILENAKLKPDDYTYTYAGATAERFAALSSGGVDAAILFPPFSYRALNAGYPLLDDVSKYFPAFMFDAFCVRPDWGAAHRDLVVKFSKGYLQSVQWLYNPVNRARAIRILVDTTNVTPEDASETYDLFVTKLHIYTPTGEISPTSLGTVIDALVKIGQIKSPAPAASKYYDSTYVAQANAELKAHR